MKMLTEGKAKVSTYRVEFFHQDTLCCLDVETVSAQEAVNYIRKLYGKNVTGIKEVWKVVNNWK